MTKICQQRPQVTYFGGSAWPAALLAVLIPVLAWSSAGCGGSSGTPDGSASGNHDGGTDAAGTGGHAGTGGTAGGAGGAAGAANLANMGNTCTADADCGAGLTCLTAAGKVLFGLDGPAHGYCTKMCAADADCSGFGVCLNVAANGAPQVDYCFQTCTFGSAATKCHNRPDVGCLTIDDTTSPTTDICFPICSQDSDCPSGRKCDLANAACADTAAPGDPLGTHCVSSADASASTCAAGCLPIGSAAGGGATVASFCSMLCRVGNLNACNWVGAGMSLTTGGTHGVCALSSSTANIGDIGFCSQECDTAANCSDQTDATGLTCDTSQMSLIGHGVCSWN